jgi:hypothetical protein
VNAGRITEIVRHRYETGAYGNAHFAMSAATMAAIRESAPPPPKRFGATLGTLGDLLAIPVRIDEALPDGAWRLVDNSSGDVIRSSDGDTR